MQIPVIWIKKISVNLLNTVIVCRLIFYLLKLKLTDFVNNFCFQKLFPLPPFLPWLCHRILTSTQKARTGENIAAESCWVTLCNRKQVCRRSNHPHPLLSEYTRLCFPPTSFTKSLYTFHFSLLPFSVSVCIFSRPWRRCRRPEFPCKHHRQSYNISSNAQADQRSSFKSGKSSLAPEC